MNGATLCKSIKDFISSSHLSGVLLCSAVLASLVLANSPISTFLDYILHYKIGFEGPSLALKYNVNTWINDGLMTLFFLLVGLEIKREIKGGELASPRKASLPILCAIGGAIVPAIIFISINSGKPTISGWGIPMATDIAFALAVINLLGKRIPSSLKIFLVALAIVDDLLAIVVIALFYTDGIAIDYLAYAGLGLLVLALMNYRSVQNPYLYLLPGLFIWYFIHHSGIHATIAGVLIAMTIPTSTSKGISPLARLEHSLLKPVNLLILPLFAFANTNIALDTTMLSGLYAAHGLGISLGLLLGKPIGILLMSYLCVTFRVSPLPHATQWQHILGAGLLAGIGFTMSIFITMLSFTQPNVIAEAKLAILLTSILAGALGYITLYTAKVSKTMHL